AAGATLLTGEQSNSAALVATERGDRLFVKLYRRLERGPNPEVELLGHLTRADVRFVPHLLGTAHFRRGAETIAMGVVQEALAAERNGWDYATEKVGQFLDRVAGSAPPDEAEVGSVPAWLEETAPEVLELARTLGVRTAEMHRALATAETLGLRPEPGTPEDHADFADRLRAEVERTRAMLAEQAHA